MPDWSVSKQKLSPPTLVDLVDCLNSSLTSNFKSVTVTVSPCPDLRSAPFHLAAEGLSGNERVADIGGPPNLHPFPRKDRIYSLPDMTRLMEMPPSRGFVLGAGAGPFHVLGVNSEAMPNLSYEGDEVTNLTYYAKVKDDGGVMCEKSPSQDCGFMANLYGSDGQPDDVIKIVAKTRTGELDFISAIQRALKAEYGERPVSMGGVFLIKAGKANLHVMPDFSEEALTLEKMKDWLRFYDMSAPLVCLSVFHSHDPGLDLRMEHTHCFSQHGEGGHYHEDTTPDEVEYEAYFNVAKWIYRIDRPAY